jgi:hypothetical protein
MTLAFHFIRIIPKYNRRSCHYSDNTKPFITDTLRVTVRPFTNISFIWQRETYNQKKLSLVPAKFVSDPFRVEG